MQITIEDDPDYIEGIHGNAQDFPGVSMNEAAGWINRRGSAMLDLKQGDQLTSFSGPEDEIVFLCKTGDRTGYRASPAGGRRGASVHKDLIEAHVDDPADAYEFRRTDFEHPEFDSPVFAAVPKDRT